ncbi:MAG: mechanosensitive ion channel [Synergistaceae bacterium]|nr:mechanosensitive ion channel [Synergistaceae bacterium]
MNSTKAKFLSALLILIMIPSLSFSAEQQELAADYVARIQSEISSDISKLKASAETELEGMKLDSADIARRIQEISELTAKSSDDMAAWGYTPEQRELHSRILSELAIAYSAYGALVQAPSTQASASDDISSLGNTASPDINTSDALRQEIMKVSRGLDVQVFYLQSKIGKLRLDLAEAATLQKQLKEAQEGGEALGLPRTHVLDLESARINAALSRLQVRAQKAVFDRNVQTIQRLRRRLSDMDGKLSFSQELLDSNLEKLQTRLKELTDEMNAARKALDSSNSSLIRARAALTSADTTAVTNASATYMARSARVSYWEYMVSMLNDEIALVREAQDIWRSRYKLFHDQATGEEIWKIRDDAAEKIQELQRQLDSVRSMESSIIREINTTQALSEQEGLSSTAKQSVIQAVEVQRKIITDIFNRYESMIPNAVFLWQRLSDEANNSLSAVRIAEKVSSFSYETVMGFLNTELWQGEGYSVTVSKLVIAVVVLLSSFFLSSWGSNMIKRRIMKRAKASITAANAIQRITFYILWIAFALIALNIVDIPLTAFAFMGGAMAVGIGFGMQNIFNNLISGFIVIFSRPFKVNDIVEVAGTQGVVEDIGSRSTTIRTWDGLDVVLPNRYFLENSVTNWTGTDLKKREVLKVSVSYDADTREVERILLDVVNGHSQVLKNPSPFVIFKNFGDDGLEFEIYYWFELRKGSGAKISSDMRHHISAVFKREGIGIPYPQRDIHIIPPQSEAPVESDESGNA